MVTGIYARVSTEEQAREGFSIRAQEEKLRSYAAVKDWPLFDVYLDEGISGKNVEDRPALQRLLHDIDAGKVENVLVFKVDRLTRSTKNLIELVEFFHAHKCGFNSLTESIDTASATGRMFLKIIGIFAEFERENLIERVRFGLARKVEEGYSLCAYTASYGYTRPKGQKVQTIVPEEAAVVREIFDCFLDRDFACHKIAAMLNSRQVPAKRGGLWTAKTVRLILENPNYIGKVRHRCHDAARYVEFDGLHAPILEETRFLQAREKLRRDRKLERTKRADESAYFARIAVCAACGSRLTPKMNYGRKKPDGSRTIYRAYRCIQSTKGNCAFSCTHRALEAAFESFLEGLSDLEGEVNPALRHIKANWLALTNKEREAFLMRFVEKIVVTAEKRGKRYQDVRVLDICFEDSFNANQGSESIGWL